MTGNITRVDQMRIYARRMYEILSISHTQQLPPWESLSDDAKHAWAMIANYAWAQGWNQAMDHVKGSTRYATEHIPDALLDTMPDHRTAAT